MFKNSISHAEFFLELNTIRFKNVLEVCFSFVSVFVYVLCNNFGGLVLNKKLSLGERE